MAEAVVVGVRVRPFNEREKKLEATVCLEMDGPKTTIRNADDEEKVFTFDESFWSHDGMEDDGTGYMKASPGSNYADQRHVYDAFGERVLDNAWKGFHCCLFAYGQTGAGKSYSMVGYGNNKGIVPISCEEIFLRIGANTSAELSYEVTVSMVEIYNEAVQDLLIDPDDRPRKGLEIRESKLLGIYIDGVTKRPVADYPSIEATIEEAVNHRTVGSTLMNATSSRAHTVQIIEFKQSQKNPGGKDSVKVSMINLVDLAGSEKAGQTGASGDRLKEGAMINKSLSALGNVIEKLAERSMQAANAKKPVVIPYRDSKLTRLLQNALGGSSKTIMVCALSPASSNYEETLSTLRYADRAKKIKNNATVNENPQDKLIRELKEENAKLKSMMGGIGTDPESAGPSAKEFEDMKEQKKKIEDGQAALLEMQKSFDQKMLDAQEKQAQQAKLHSGTTEGTGRRKSITAVLQAQVEEAHMLVNLNSDPQLTGRMKYNLDEGKTVRVGNSGLQQHKLDSDSDSSSSSSGSSDSSSDSGDEKPVLPEIDLHHETVFEDHAVMTTRGGVVRFFSQGEAADHTFVNGRTFTQLRTEMMDAKRSSAEKRPSILEAFGGMLGLGGSEPAAEEAGAEGADGAEDEKPMGAAKSEFAAPGTDAAVLKALGKTALSEGIVLQHGDRVVFGDTCFFYCDATVDQPEVKIIAGTCFFYCDSSKEQPESMLLNKKVTYAGATEELSKSALTKLKSGLKGVNTLQHLKTTLEEAQERDNVYKTEMDALRNELEAANETAAENAAAAAEELQGLSEENELRTELCTEASEEIHTLKEELTEREAIITAGSISAGEELTQLREAEAKLRADLVAEHAAAISTAEGGSQLHGEELAKRDAELQAAVAKHAAEVSELTENEAKLRKDLEELNSGSEKSKEELAKKDADLQAALSKQTEELQQLKEAEAKVRKDLEEKHAAALSSVEGGAQAQGEEIAKRDAELQAAVAKHSAEVSELTENEAKVRKDLEELNSVTEKKKDELAKKDADLQAALSKQSEELQQLKEAEAKVRKDLEDKHAAALSSMEGGAQAHGEEIAKRDAELQSAVAKHAAEVSELKENDAKVRKDLDEHRSVAEKSKEELAKKDGDLQAALSKQSEELQQLKESEAKVRKDLEDKHAAALSSVEGGAQAQVEEIAKRDAELQAAIAKHAAEVSELKENEAKELAKLKSDLEAAGSKHTIELTEMRETEAKIQKDLLVSESSAMEKNKELHVEELAKHTAESAQLKENEAQLRKDFADQIAAASKGDMEKSNALHTEELERAAEMHAEQLVSNGNHVRSETLQQATAEQSEAIAKLKGELAEEHAQALAAKETALREENLNFARQASDKDQKSEQDAEALQKALSELEEKEKDIQAFEHNHHDNEELHQELADKDSVIATLEASVQELETDIGERQEITEELRRKNDELHADLDLAEASSASPTHAGGNMLSEGMEAQKTPAESMSGSFHDAVRALDLVEAALNDLVSKREQKKKDNDFGMF